MDNALMLALQTQRVLQRRMDMTANNLANVTTTGFKADELVLGEADDTKARVDDDPHDVRFVRDLTTMHDLSQGAITNTGNPLDVAIQGDGYFMVQGPNGVAYTRDGAFSISADGHLVTSDGYQVLGQGGGPLVFDTSQGGSPEISRDGAISLNGVEVGRLGIASFANPQALTKYGQNLWSANGQASHDFEGVVIQGAIETSNVNPVLELTQLIAISRAYESAAKIVSNTDDLRQRALQRLGQIQ